MHWHSAEVGVETVWLHAGGHPDDLAAVVAAHDACAKICSSFDLQLRDPQHGSRHRYSDLSPMKPNLIGVRDNPDGARTFLLPPSPSRIPPTLTWEARYRCDISIVHRGSIDLAERTDWPVMIRRMLAAAKRDIAAAKVRERVQTPRPRNWKEARDQATAYLATLPEVPA